MTVPGASAETVRRVVCAFLPDHETERDQGERHYQNAHAKAMPTPPTITTTSNRSALNMASIRDPWRGLVVARKNNSQTGFGTVRFKHTADDSAIALG